MLVPPTPGWLVPPPMENPGFVPGSALHGTAETFRRGHRDLWRGPHKPIETWRRDHRDLWKDHGDLWIGLYKPMETCRRGCRDLARPAEGVT